MPPSKNANLVLNAERNRRVRLVEAVASLSKGIALDSYHDQVQALGPWARELNYVNQHITVPQEQIDDAAEAYHSVARRLVSKLKWPDDAIKVLPQGSAGTQTLIRSPDRSKFDVDAVCQVDLNRIAARDPIAFFDEVGKALEPLSPTRKNRCWNIDFPGEPFYLEFTPSVPMDTVPTVEREAVARRYIPVEQYRSTALAVVDNKTHQWKTSNPEGMTKWVNDIAQLQLIRFVALESATALDKSLGIEPVPDQDVEITDTLKVAIRLFKRHRDMCVFRQKIDKDFKPISIIIVTLLTSCYAGLADLRRTYSHPVELLVDLADLLPGMVLKLEGEYRIDNPTVEGENFAERWNQDDGERYEAFETWCDILAADMRTILAATDPQEIRERVRSVFGCGGNTSGSGGSSGTGGSGGSGNQQPTRRPPPPPPRTTGLA